MAMIALLAQIKRIRHKPFRKPDVYMIISIPITRLAAKQAPCEAGILTIAWHMPGPIIRTSRFRL
ncbi:hypothetical protein A0U90_10435 [Kozakia baliensis]|nr:hypothetical protein A0U90_10435 [Kozakia baliensis]